MTIFNGKQMTLLAADTNPDPGFTNGTVRTFIEEVTLATQTTSDTINVARLPKGAVPLYGVISTDTSLSTATIAIGITGTVGKYRAAATFTATNTPTFFGVTAGISTALTDEETVFITIAVASLPAAGKLTVTMVYAFD